MDTNYLSDSKSHSSNLPSTRKTMNSLERHIQECADECGVDWPPTSSNEKTIAYKGHTIEVWYDEDSGSPFAWRAFVKGIGTENGACDDEAIDAAKAKIDSL